MNAPVALSTTYSDTAKALSAMLASMPKPLLLHDALTLKRARGDTDVDGFKIIASQYGSGLNATVGGALDAMQQWTRKGIYPRTPAIVAFMADLDAIQAGTFGRRAA